MKNVMYALMFAVISSGPVLAQEILKDEQAFNLLVKGNDCERSLVSARTPQALIAMGYKLIEIERKETASERVQLVAKFESETSNKPVSFKAVCKKERFVTAI